MVVVVVVVVVVAVVVVVVVLVLLLWLFLLFYLVFFPLCGFLRSGSPRCSPLPRPVRTLMFQPSQCSSIFFFFGLTLSRALRVNIFTAHKGSTSAGTSIETPGGSDEGN